MATVSRSVETPTDREMLNRFLDRQEMPFTITVTKGKKRTVAQNHLQFLWANEIAQQKGDMTPDEVRAYCKLTLGVPILRAQNEVFRAKYDELVRPRPYEEKIALMTEPIDLPVTRIMTTKQKTEYLDAIARHFGEQGIILTMPEEGSY